MIDDCYFFRDLIGKISGESLEKICNFEDDRNQFLQNKQIDDVYNEEANEARQIIMTSINQKQLYLSSLSFVYAYNKLKLNLNQSKQKEAQKSQEPFQIDSNDNFQDLSQQDFKMFIDNYIMKSLICPLNPLPINLNFEDGENKQNFQTFFQEYIHKKSNELKHETVRPQNINLQSFQSNKMQQSQNTDEKIKLPNESIYKKTLVSDKIYEYFKINKDQIVLDLQKNENEELLKYFYHSRWFHFQQKIKANMSLQKQEKSYFINVLYRLQLFSKNNAYQLLIHLISNTVQLIVEFCEIVNNILEEKKQTITQKNECIVNQKYYEIIMIYTYFWKHFSASIVNIDENMKFINQLINEIYSNIETYEDSDEDPQMFSFLRYSMQIWHSKVYKKNYKSLEKAMKVLTTCYFKNIEKEMFQFLQIQSHQEYSIYKEKHQYERLILNSRNSLIDLSLNLNSVNYIEHSNFIQLLTGNNNLNEDIDETACSIDQIESLQSNFDKFAFNSQFQIFNAKIINEFRWNKIINQPSLIFSQFIVKQSIDFFQNTILNLATSQQNNEIKIYNHELLNQLISFWLEKMDSSSFFDQQQFLKKQILIQMSQDVLNPIKQQVQQMQNKYNKKIQKLGKNIECEIGDKQQVKKQPLFNGYFGQYLEENQIARDVQKHILRHKLIQKADQDIFNSLSNQINQIQLAIDQKNSKIKIQKHEFDRNIINLCLEPFNFGTIETDVRQNIKCRERKSIIFQNRLNNSIINMMGQQNLHGNNENIDRSLSQSQLYKTEQISLVPYDNYRSSLISIKRDSQILSEDSQRLSYLYNSISQMDPKDPILNNIICNKEIMLNFFSAASISSSEPNKLDQNQQINHFVD